MIVNHVDLEGIMNFRDFGGISGEKGRLRPGKLFRSGHHANATQRDLAHLAALDIPLIVDLRKRDEKARHPSKRPVNFTGRVLERSDGIDEAEQPPLAFLAEPNISPDSIRRRMNRVYAELPYEEPLLPLFRRYFASLADISPSSVLIHCHAGKDRTGVLVALTQFLLGVSADDRMREYLLTNATSRVENRLPEMAAGFLKVHRKPVDEALLRIVMHASPDYLQTAFDTIRDQDSSVDAYFERRLGLNGAARARIEQCFLH